VTEIIDDGTQYTYKKSKYDPDHGRWFSPGTPASSTTKNGRHDIAEILLKVALKHQKSKKIIKML
jgi:hypothetical protein